MVRSLSSASRRLSADYHLEQGKPLAEARSEISHGASFVQWFAQETRRIYGDVVPANSMARRIVVLKQPTGVVVAITPLIFPKAMITRKVAAGCTTEACSRDSVLRAGPWPNSFAEQAFLMVFSMSSLVLQKK